MLRQARCVELQSVIVSYVALSQVRWGQLEFGFACYGRNGVVGYD